MVEIPELVRGHWLEGLSDEDAHQVQIMCYLLESCIADAFLSLVMFEQAQSQPRPQSRRETWDRDREAERKREEELAAEDPRQWGAPDYFEWQDRIREQARRDVVRAKWGAGELPEAYLHRVPFIHARSFVNSLAQLDRALSKLATMEIGDAQQAVLKARDGLEAGLPQLKHVRDSAEHAEDRLRGLDRHGQPIALAPVSNTMVEAPGGGVLIADSLNGRCYGWTVEDGTYQEVEVSSGTVELARAGVQAAFDALPWTEGHRHYSPHA